MNSTSYNMEKQSPSAAQLRRFYGLLKSAGAAANKEDILAGYGVESAKDLTPKQMDELCEGLQRIVEGRKNAPPEIRKARSRVLFLCTDLGVFNGRNWQHLNDFIKLPRIAGKLLYECDLTELDALNKKLRAMLKKRLERITAENEQALKN